MINTTDPHLSRKQQMSLNRQPPSSSEDRQGEKRNSIQGDSIEHIAEMPAQFDVMVTNACNARCAFCVQEATFKSAHGSNERFMAAFKRHFAEFYETGGRRVVITGGEPLLALQRVIGVLGELAKYPALVVKALYTNGERLVHSTTNGGSYASTLARAGLSCVNLSVHHDDESTNNRIFALPDKALTENITCHLRTCGLPYRFNLTLQRGGIETLADIVRYARWAFSQGVIDIYVRELFRFAFAEPKCDSDRDPLNYCLARRVSVSALVDQMKVAAEFEFLRTSSEKSRDKLEHEFVYLPSGRKIYLSTLTIGTEHHRQVPYLILMPDGQLYRGWLGPEQTMENIPTRADRYGTMGKE